MYTVRQVTLSALKDYSLYGIVRAMIEVAATDDFVTWYDKITIPEALAVAHAVAHIELEGSEYGAVVRVVGEKDEIRIHRLQLKQYETAAPPGSETPPTPWAIGLCYASDLTGLLVLLLSGDNSGDAEPCAGVVASAEQLWLDYRKSANNGHRAIGNIGPT